MNQSQQLAHLMHSYATANEQQVLQQYLANSNSFQHAHVLAAQLNSMASINNSSNLLNNFTAFNSLTALAAQQAGLSTSSPISSTNSSTTGLNQSNVPMLAAAAQLLQAQQKLNGLSAASLLQQCDPSATMASQQSPSSNSNCSSPPTCSSVTPPTPPLQLSSANTSLQLLAAQHYNFSSAASLANASSSTNGSSSSSNNQSQNQLNSSNSNNPSSLTAAAAAAVLNGQTSLASLVANSQTSIDSTKRLSISPDCFSMDVPNSDLNEIQQYYTQLNALKQQLLLNNAAFNIPTTSSSKALFNQQQPMKNLAKLYSAINCNTIGDLNSPINSSLSSSSSSTNSLQNSVINTNIHHSNNQAAAAAMAAAMATTGSGVFPHNAHMQLLSPNSIKTLKFSIENILSPSFGNSPAELAAVAAANASNQITPITSIESSPMSKLFEFKSKSNFFSGSNLKKYNNSTNKISTSLTPKQQLSNKLELVNSDINSLSSIINNLNPGLSSLDFKLNSSKRKKRSSSSLDEHSGGEKDGIESFCSSVKRKNSIDSDCSNSNSSVHVKVNGIKSLADSSTSSDTKNHLAVSPKFADKSKPLPTPEEIKNGTQEVPAWVYCTRYSDRPSSGPRSRKTKRKDKNIDEKRPRTAFTSEQLAKLKQEFEGSMYLSDAKRNELSRSLKLDEAKIKIWFQNRRAKSKKHSQGKSVLAQSLSAQGLYNHSTVALDDSDDEEENRIANASNGSNNFKIDSNSIDQADNSLSNAK